MIVTLVQVYLIVGAAYCLWTLRDDDTVRRGFAAVRRVSPVTVAVFCVLTLILFWPVFVVNGVTWKGRV
jgi:hypothetical protein